MPKNSQVAHLWANKSKDSSSSRASLYFNGDKIFSYGSHFVIAKHVTNKKGMPAVLFTKRECSITTARHKSEVRYALDGLNIPVFYVSEVDPFDYNSETEWKAEFQKQGNEAASRVAKAKRARSRGEDYLSEARAVCDAMAQARAFFGIKSKAPSFEDIGPDSNWLAKIAEAKRKEDARTAKLRKKQEAERIEAERLQRIEGAAKMQEWLAGMKVYLPYFMQEDDNRSAYIRTLITDDGDVIAETSRGAEVPIKDAIRAYRFIKMCRTTGKRFDTNGHSIRVGEFNVRWIDENGNAQIGCHYLSWERISEWAERSIATGLQFDTTPSTDALEVTEHA
jgi:hypothetical protein